MDHLKTITAEQTGNRRFRQVLLRKEKGMALILSLLILVLLTLLAVTGLQTSIVEEQISGNQKLAARALFAAEQGVSEALEDLFDGTISDTGSESSTTWNAVGSVSGTGYSAAYVVRHLAAAGATVANVNDDGRTYFAIDSIGNASESARRMLQVAVAMEMGGESNVAGLIGCQGITAKGNVVTSSYSSSGQASDGDRGDVATTDEYAFMYLDGSSDFDIVGEVRSTGALYLGSDSLVRRDALAPLRITTQSNAHIYGSASTNGNFDGRSGSVSGDINQGNSVVPDPVVAVKPCDPLDIDSIFDDAVGIKTANDNSGIGRCSGCSYTGNPGNLGTPGGASDYYFSSFTLDGEETVTIRGDVRIYIENNFTMKSKPELILNDGASLTIYLDSGRFWMDSEAKANHDPDDDVSSCNPGGCPGKLTVYSKTSNSKKDDKNWRDDEPDVWDDSQDIAGVKIDSNSEFYGMIYAPRAHVVLYSNSEIYGSVRGIFVTTDSNLDFFYDEDLDSLWGGLPTDYQLVYWTEIYDPSRF
jgi:Tfp pilus assembly protein PilX